MQYINYTFNATVTTLTTHTIKHKAIQKQLTVMTQTLNQLTVTTKHQIVMRLYT